MRKFLRFLIFLLATRTPKNRGGSAGSDGERGQGNFELVANFGYIHEGQLTLAKAYVALHPEEAASGRFRR